MNRRGFLAGILAAAVAPAYVKYGSLMMPRGAGRIFTIGDFSPGTIPITIEEIDLESEFFARMNIRLYEILSDKSIIHSSGGALLITETIKKVLTDSGDPVLKGLGAPGRIFLGETNDDLAREGIPSEIPTPGRE
jgi:hypothetical protein